MITQNVLSRRFMPMLTLTASTHRKPRWLPVAKSKIYRIPKRPEVSEEERVELLRLNNNYHSQMRAIKKFYYHEMMKEKLTTESASSEMSIQLEAEEWKQCEQLNAEWNKQVALDREERRKLELKTMDEYALSKMEYQDRKAKLRVEKAAEVVRKEKVLAKTFITPETLDAAIDNAIANPKDYNFAIDLKGTVYQGRDTLAAPPREEKSSATSA